MKVYIHTLGCKVNQYESQGISELFASRGAEVTAIPEEADVIIVNSCTVTAESDRKTRQSVRHLRGVNPDAVIILAGCMAEAFPQKAAETEGADIIIGNKDYGRIFDTYEEYLAGGGAKLLKIEQHEKGDVFSTPPVTGFNERTRAYIKIEDGCDRFCTYCVIPRARGRVRSRSVDDIKNEAEALGRAGFKEIVLVGINLTAYGTDIGATLFDAVNAAASAKGIERIRFGSMEPDQIDDETLILLSKCEKFCPQFHLSLQSGCDKTLKRMNRKYDTSFYLDLVERIRAMFVNTSITTDIMVGFAGESEEDFNESAAFAEKVGFARMHIFAYSRRQGTAAYSYPDQVTNAEKARRSSLMSKTAAKLTRSFCESQVNLRAKVLFESEQDGICRGYTENYTEVSVKSKEHLHGEIKDVIITGASADSCIGILCD